MENLFYKWKQLWEGVFHIQDLFSDYMYLVVGEEKAALIDTGMGFPGLRQLVERLTDKPVIVLNTHGHLDHIGGNDEFGCIYLHPDDLVVYAEHGMDQRYGTGIGSRAFRRDHAGVGLQPAEKTVGIRKSGKIGKQCVECKGTEKTRTYGFTYTDQSGRQGVGSASHPGTYEGLCLLLRQKK